MDSLVWKNRGRDPTCPSPQGRTLTGIGSFCSSDPWGPPSQQRAKLCQVPWQLLLRPQGEEFSSQYGLTGSIICLRKSRSWTFKHRLRDKGTCSEHVGPSPPWTGGVWLGHLSKAGEDRRAGHCEKGDSSYCLSRQGHVSSSLID